MVGTSLLQPSPCRNHADAVIIVALAQSWCNHHDGGGAGYIDLRRVTAVREATKTVVMDGAKGASGESNKHLLLLLLVLLLGSAAWSS